MKFICHKNHHVLLDLHPKVRNYIYLCNVPGPLTGFEICGYSGDRRKFFLCKNRNNCLRIDSIVELFRTQREHTVNQPSAATKTSASILPASASCFPCSPMKICIEREASPDRIVNIDSRLDRFKLKCPNNVTVKTTCNVGRQARHGGEEEMRSNVLDICRKFCKPANRPARQVPLCCLFQLYFLIYF
jgi:hypothetical protein